MIFPWPLHPISASPTQQSSTGSQVFERRSTTSYDLSICRICTITILDQFFVGVAECIKGRKKNTIQSQATILATQLLLLQRFQLLSCCLMHFLTPELIDGTRNLHFQCQSMTPRVLTWFQKREAPWKTKIWTLKKMVWKSRAFGFNDWRVFHVHVSLRGYIFWAQQKL